VNQSAGPFWVSTLERVMFMGLSGEGLSSCELAKHGCRVAAGLRVKRRAGAGGRRRGAPPGGAAHECGHGDREHDAAGEGDVDAVGEQLTRAGAGGAGRGEEGGEDAEPERATEVVRDVDEPAGDSGVRVGQMGTARPGRPSARSGETVSSSASPMRASSSEVQPTGITA
jgi:hypothetical protein